MTNEEAIKILNEEKDFQNTLADKRVFNAISIAVEALRQKPYEDCISRQEAISAIIDEYYPDAIAIDIVDIIANMPSVTPKAKTGQWIAQDIHNCHTDFKCSACGYIHDFMHLYGKPTADYTYCPNCGARMAESEKGDI